MAPSAVGEYREIYDAVGGPFQWTRRVVMSDQELGELLALAGVEVWVLEEDGVAAGFTELDCRRTMSRSSTSGLLPRSSAADSASVFSNGW